MLTKTKQARIKFNVHSVSNGIVKAHVWYSSYARRGDDGDVIAKLYAKDFDSGRALLEIFGSEVYSNETDIQSDYFEKGDVTFDKNHPYHGIVLEMIELKASRKRSKKVR